MFLMPLHVFFTCGDSKNEKWNINSINSIKIGQRPVRFCPWKIVDLPYFKLTV